MELLEIIGIDLGTTYSAAAVWNPQTEESEVLVNSEGGRLTPSVVVFNSAAGAYEVGEKAAERMVDNPSQTVYSIKRFIGRMFDDASVGEDREHLTYAIEKNASGQVSVRIDDASFTPAEISAEILRKVKRDAEAALGGRKVTKAVVTVPAYFDELQRQATKLAGELAGLYVPRIISEPTAAALAFGLGAEPQTVAVYDLGGGTFDLSILRIKGGRVDTIAVDGDTHLGGDDFDLMVVEWIKQEYLRAHGVNLKLEGDAGLRALLREQAERAKVALSAQSRYEIDLPELPAVDGRSLSLKTTLIDAQLAELVRPLIDRTLLICEHALESARAKSRAGGVTIDQVLLVGGQSRMPAIKRAIAERLGWKINDRVNPDEAVAKGAAVLGARLCGYLENRLKLWDVTPLSVGIQLKGGTVEHVIRANQKIPIIVERDFTTHYDNQQSIDFRIVQGESLVADENTLIGKVTLNLSTPRPAREPRIRCSFEINEDSILQLTVKDTDTEGGPVVWKFDHVYEKLTLQQVDEQIKKAVAGREKGAALLAAVEELERLRLSAGDKLTADHILRERFEAAEAAFKLRDVEAVTRLLQAIRDVL